MGETAGGKETFGRAKKSFRVTLKITGLPLVSLISSFGRTATPVDFVVMLSSDDCEGVPFEIGIETLKWTFPSGDYVTVERNTSGYFISGRVGGKDWHDEDHEDFFCADTDEYLDFLEKHGLLGMLSVSPSA